MNYCSGCKEDFGSVSAFDAHRVGKHAYTFPEGLALDPSREDGRRCLSTPELAAKGWSKDSRGRWRQPADPNARMGIRNARYAAATVPEG